MVEHYEFGKIKIDGKEYVNDILILKDGSVKEWGRIEGHKLAVKDIEALIRERPQSIVIGTGEGGVMQVPQEVVKSVINKGIDMVVEKTPAATQKYNDMLKEGVIVSAGLHLTC